MTGLKREKNEASAGLSGKDISLQNELIENLFKEYFRESAIGSANNNLKTLLLKILESTEGNIALCSIPGFKILYITPSMAELLQIKSKNQLKAPIDKYLRIKSKTEFENSLNQLKPDGSAIMMELRIGVGGKEKETASFSFGKAVLGEKTILLVTNPRLEETESKMAEIQRSEERYRTLVENIYGVFYSLDSNGVIHYISPAIEKLSDYKPNELVGKSFPQFIHSEDLPGLMENFKSDLSGNLGSYDYRVTKKRGGYIWVRSYSQVIGTPENPQGLSGILIDITEKKRAQEALEESERKYRLIVDNSLAGIYVTQKHILKYCNQQFVEMFGYKSPAEIIGKHVKEFVSPESWETVDKNVQMRERGEARVSRYEFGAINKDGVRFDVEVFGGRIIYEGKPAIQGMIIDITERKRAEESLYAQIERIQRQQTAIVQLATSPNVISGDIDSALQATTEIAADALDCERVSVWMFNEKGTEIRCIDLFERSLNKYSSGATLSVNDHPEYFASLKTGRVLETTDSRNDPRTRSFTESYLIPYGIFSMLEVPIRREGKVVGIVCHEHVGGMRNWHPDEVIFAGEVADQVSQLFLNAERNKAIEAMHDSEEQFSTFMDHVPAIVFLKDQEGKALYINKSFQDNFGDDWIGKTVFDKLPKEIAGPMDADDKLALTAGVTEKVETISTLKGKNHIFQTIKFPIHRSEKSPLLGGMAIDITERKMIEEEREKLIKELETKNAELESFNYTVSHDLKSPLITIKGFIGMLEYDLASGNKEKLDSNLQRIKEAADKMANLLEDLLELSKIGQAASPRVEIPFRMLISEALSLLAGSIEKSKIQIIIQPDLPIVYGVHRRLVEVLQNLIENAIKFMGEQPEPRIEIGKRKVGKVEDEIIFFVKDNGIGIEPRYHETVFGLFNKLDARSEGTGIGLALTKRIIEVHGSKIWIESKGLKKGSTFCFTIPVAKISS